MGSYSRRAAWVTALALTWSSPALAQDDEDLSRLADGVVRFVSGSSAMTPESERIMDRVVKTLERRGTERLLIVGHTDRHGSAALNRKLSRKRAEVVKGALVKRGIPAARMTTIGAGFAEPLSLDKTDQADDMNRRVELWVGVRNPLAWVSWIFQTVESKKPKTEWDAAELRQALDRLFRVRTVGQSAGEVTFTSGHRIYLGPEALVVIYGRTQSQVNQRPRTRDVTLEEGAIFARLKKKEGTPVLVETPAANAWVETKGGVRVEHDEDKKRSTYSVYDGKAEIAAQGQTVEVDRGYGTRVKNGEAPEEPTPLMPGPTWDPDAPVLVWRGEPVKLAWKPATGANGAMVDLTKHADAEFERPWRMEYTEANALTLEGIGEGAYRARVSTFDEREILGQPSGQQHVIVMKAPTDAGGEALPVDGGSLPMSRPTSVSLPLVGGVDVRWTKNGERVQGSSVPVSGGDVLGLEIVGADGKRVLTRTWKFRLSAVAIQIDRIDGPTTREDYVETSVEVTVTTLDGTPLEEPRPVVFVRGEGMLEGAPEISNEGDKVKVAPYTDPPFAEELPMSLVGVGRYRITRVHPVDANVVDESLAFVFPTARASAIVKLPVWTRPVDEVPTLRFGPYVGAMGGVQLRKNPAVSPWFSLEAGFAALSMDRLRVTMGAQAAFMPTQLFNGDAEVADLTVIPLYGRVTVAFVLGPVRPYGGIAVGARLVSVSGVTAESLGLDQVQFGVNGILGVGFGAGNFEAFVEGNYGKLALKELAFRETIGDLTFVGGLRWFFY